MNNVILLFEKAKRNRYKVHNEYLGCLPYYTSYTQHGGRPSVPHLPPHQHAYLQEQIRNAEVNLKNGIDYDWRLACMIYPEMLDYFFDLVDIKAQFPSKGDEKIARRWLARKDIGKDAVSYY